MRAIASFTGLNMQFCRTGGNWYRSPQARIHVLPNQTSFPFTPLISFNLWCMFNSISLLTIDISSITINVKLLNFVRNVFSLSNDDEVEVDWPDTRNRRDECIVMPSTLNAATPVGAVIRTVTSVGFTRCDSNRSFFISDWMIFITWLFPTPPGPLRNIRYGSIFWLFFHAALIAFLHHILLYIIICLCSLFKLRIFSLYSDGVSLFFSTSISNLAVISLFSLLAGPSNKAWFASKSSANIGRSSSVPSALSIRSLCSLFRRNVIPSMFWGTELIHNFHSMVC